MDSRRMPLGGAAEGAEPDRGRDSREATVLLGDDEAITRTGVRRTLEPHGFRIVAEAGSADEALEAAIAKRPDVCLLATGLPGGGIGAARRILDVLPETKVAMLSASDREDDVFAALRAGADGYLLKTASPERLPHSIRSILRGEAVLPRQLTAPLIRELRERGPSRRIPLGVPGSIVELTSREYETLEHLRQGRSTPEIASQLRISQVTVRRHISSLIRKLGVQDRQSAVALLDRADPRASETREGRQAS